MVPLSYQIPFQLPDYIRANYPVFVNFLQTYYEWLESTGEEASALEWIKTEVLKSLADKTFSLDAYSPIIQTYITSVLQAYDTALAAKVLAKDWANISNQELHELVIFFESYRQEDIYTLFYSRLETITDVDGVYSTFLDLFRAQYMRGFPKEKPLSLDQRLVLKNILAFYKSKGTNTSFKVFFKILFGIDVELYYPSEKIFKASDANWNQKALLKVLVSSSIKDQLVTVNLRDSILFDIGSESINGYATITDYHYVPYGNAFVFIFELKDIRGNFEIDSSFISFEKLPTLNFLRKLKSVSKISIDSKYAGTGHKKGEKINLYSLSGKGAEAYVSLVDSDGAIKQCIVIDGGLNYSSVPEVSLAPSLEESNRFLDIVENYGLLETQKESVLHGLSDLLRQTSQEDSLHVEYNGKTMRERVLKIFENPADIYREMLIDIVKNQLTPIPLRGSTFVGDFVTAIGNGAALNITQINHLLFILKYDPYFDDTEKTFSDASIRQNRSTQFLSQRVKNQLIESLNFGYGLTYVFTDKYLEKNGGSYKKVLA